jgi:N utilization substance protein B
MQSLYEWDFNDRQGNLREITDFNVKQFAPGLEDPAFIFDLIDGVVANMPQIDKIITDTAPEWPLDQITVIDRNILRLGIFELMIAKQVPPKVAINEAVELGKAFGGESSGKFINGVLGTLYKNLPEDQKQTESPDDPTPTDASAETSTTEPEEPRQENFTA